MQLDATLSWEQQSLQLSALVDSGADENFLDSNLVSQAGIPVEVLPAPLNAHALNGELLARVSHRTVPLSLHLSEPNHVFVLDHQQTKLPTCLAVRTPST
ncbi:hypothetical protein DPEC_G00155150 [Dallia pectoralis]|uniref:Uncharacterized protein n=1 Tax=Dallia pectoralis TaxID=75939 RepID=A0ACC2GKW1_DALPE|nr:hypothetical protein DPEC_G00155150 [Dallia pectoralis]